MYKVGKMRFRWPGGQPQRAENGAGQHHGARSREEAAATSPHVSAAHKQSTAEGGAPAASPSKEIY